MNLFDGVINTNTGDIHGHVRAGEGVSEVSEVRFDFPCVSRFLFCRHCFVDRFGIYVEEHYSFGNVGWSVSQQYDYAVCFSDEVPERNEQAIWRQSHDEVVWECEDVREDLRNGATETKLGVIRISQPANRNVVEPLGRKIEINEAKA